MEAHAFRIVGRELIYLLSGARIEKIHCPVQGLLVFSLFSQGFKWKMAFSTERAHPSCFIYTASLQNPQVPPNIVMRLRKYLAGHRLGQGVLDFAARQILFPVSSKIDYQFLLLKLGQEPELLAKEPEGFPQPAFWPAKNIVAKLCQQIPDELDTYTTPDTPDNPLNLIQRDEDAVFKDTVQKHFKNAEPVLFAAESVLFAKEYTTLTPQLRETIKALDLPESMALLVDLEYGGDNLFFYKNADGLLSHYQAWPLPDKVKEGKLLFEAPMPEALDYGLEPQLFAEKSPNFCITSAIDQRIYLARLGMAETHKSSKPTKQQSKKLLKLLRTLEAEEKRLQALLDLRNDACALQGALWQFGADEKQAEVYLGEGADLRKIMLDKRFTVRDNMHRMFHQSQRGARGLALLAERKAKVQAELASLNESSNLWSVPAMLEKPRKVIKQGKVPAGSNPITTFDKKHSKGRELKEVQAFKSTDGFTILRGKSAKGNQSLLKIGQPYDFWLHSKDGPSAHAIIRRTHAAEEISENTIVEAAVLVGQKSWQRYDAKAEIMVSLLCHVHPIKGAAAGTVRVDKILRTLLVNLVEHNG